MRLFFPCAKDNKILPICQVFICRVNTISGSTQVNESSGAQYTCTAYFSDGSSTNVTSSASWSQSSGYASINSSGYLTTYSVSSDQPCTITASYSGKTDTHNVTIKDGAITTTLADAIDNTALTLGTGGDGNWFYQDSIFYYDGDAAQSGNIDDDQESWMSTTLDGPGTLTFYWKVSSEDGFDYLRYYVANILQDSISGNVDWQEETVDIDAQGTIVQWTYDKDSSISSGSDCGWVDRVIWTPESCTVPNPPTNIIASDTDSSGIQVSWTFVTGASSYKIYRAISAGGAKTLLDSTSETSYSDTSASIGTTYYYWVIATNACGDSTYSAYDRGYRPEDGSLPNCSLEEAVDNSDLTFTTAGDAGWFCQNNVSYYGGDAAQSGNIGDSSESWMGVTLNGPGTLSFYWKVYSEVTNDYLEFTILKVG